MGETHRSGLLRRVLFIATGLALAWAPTRVGADFRQTTLREAVAAADSVLILHVDRVEVRYGSLDGVRGDVPFRVVCGRVLERWRGTGREADCEEIWVPGGPTRDGGEYMVSTSPSVAGLAGHDVLAFVKRDHFGAGRMGLPFCDQGLYRLTRSRKRGEVLVLGKAGAPIERDVEKGSLRTSIQALAPEEHR